MTSPKKNPTRNEAKNQRPFGRVPDDLEPVLAQLSHLEAHVFIMLTIHAIRSPKDPKVGCVNISKSALAREMGLNRTSLRRAIKGLFDADLLLPGGSSCPMSWGVMPHPLVPHDSGGGSSGTIKSPQPQQNITTYEPLIRSEDVSEDVVDAVAAGNGHKKPRRRPSWLIWDSDKEQLMSRPEEEFQKRRDEFFSLWFERLGNEEAVYEQLYQADEWLKKHPTRRGKVKRFDMFFGKWLDRCLEG